MNETEAPIKLREAELFWREADGDILVLDGRKWEYLQLNKSGETLWRRLIDGATVSSLVSELIEAYEIDETRATADVHAFVEHLGALGLLD